MKTIELHEARTAYAITLEDLVHSDEPIIIEREGKPVAVVLPYELYQQLTTPPAAPQPKLPSDESFERNRAAYYAIKPELLKTHRGKFVAFHNGELVDSDADEPTLVERVHAKYTYGTLFIHFVDEPERIYHIPGPRLLRNG
ncbi:MAG: type II toxin-antitoxin system Phd/YefM family antitoxin [Chloroflexota bacterium]|nr:type II toxin-antitoxin system Phd/YefM family antitoxin [Chloroflexota bacterium]